MQIYQCAIVEDEPLAVTILEDYIREIPFLQLKAVCKNAFEALEVLKQEKIDLLFLDIHLPVLKGLDFLQSISNPPKVIITTAYHQYALESYEHGVIDYLLKPIEFSRFLKAVNKLNSSTQPTLPTNVSTPENRPFVFCTVGKKRVKVYPEDICYIESQKEYSKIVCIGKTLLTKLNQEQMNTFMTAGNCLRVHRSFLVSLNRIDSYSASEIEIAGFTIPVGRSYKELVQKTLEELGK